MSTVYTVQATLVGRYWDVYVPTINRSTQARNMKEIATMAKDLIAIMTSETQPQINIEYIVPQEVRESLDYKAQAQQLEQLAQAKQRQAATLLHDKGMSFREIGALLGVSYQRAHQLVAQS